MNVEVGHPTRAQIERMPFEMWGEKFGTIKNKESRLVPFVMTELQRRIDAYWHRQPLVILGPRQGRKSSYFMVRSEHRMTTIPGTEVTLLSYEAKATARMLTAFDTWYENLPDWYRPRLTKNAAEVKTLDWEDGSPASSIYIGTVGKRSFGRGHTTNMAILTESAHPPYPSNEDNIIGLTESIPKPELGGIEVWESTAFGPGGPYYERYIAGKEGRVYQRGQERVYTSLHLPWYIVEDYVRGDPEDWEGIGELWPNEIPLVRDLGLKADRIRWRRWKIARLRPLDCGPGGMGEMLFLREYAEDDITAFMSLVGRPFIPPTVIAQHAKVCAQSVGKKARIFEDRKTGVIRWEYGV